MSTRWGVFIVGALTIAIATALFAGEYGTKATSVKIGGHSFKALIADEQAEREQGLSGMHSLSEGRVMLFIFPSTGKHGIWMKDMRFSIDILWADSDGTIIHIEERVAPDTYPHVYRPIESAQYVIEMNAGVVEQLGIAVGQHMEAWPSG